jgi:hypothetical protein
MRTAAPNANLRRRRTRTLAANAVASLAIAAAAATSAPEPPAAERIDALLASDPAAALAACRAIDAGDDATPRDRGRFLQQYGRALAAGGDHRGATLVLVRGALLDADSRWAARSALLAAESARLGWNDSPEGPALVGSLARLALDLAGASGDDETRRAAEAALGRRNP